MPRCGSLVPQVADSYKDSVAGAGRCPLPSCSSSFFPVPVVFFPHRSAWDSSHRLLILCEICRWEGGLQPVRPCPVWTMYIHLLGLRCLGLHAVWPCRVSALTCGAAEITVPLPGCVLCRHHSPSGYRTGQDLAVHALPGSSQDSVILLKESHASQVSVACLKQLPGLTSLVVWSSESLLELQ